MQIVNNYQKKTKKNSTNQIEKALKEELDGRKLLVKGAYL